ncbi:MAG: DUF1059 domain-containing protein [Chloroflexota bacterium]|nr:DUF1059 domain-containing protein [Chloroflexota bacterium]
MAKGLRCRDVGLGCDGVLRAATAQEISKQAVEHAQTVHGMKEISEQVVQKVRAVIRDE